MEQKKKLCTICESPYHYQTFCPRKKRKPISQFGKKAQKWEEFRDKIAIPYLDRKFGRRCNVKRCGRTNNLDPDHIKNRGSHPELALEIENIQYLCRPHHRKKTDGVKLDYRFKTKYHDD